jgi:hypothetical protein
MATAIGRAQDAVAAIEGFRRGRPGHQRQGPFSRAIERLGVVLISGLIRSSIQNPMMTPTRLVHELDRAIHHRRIRHDNHIHQDRRTRPE